MNSIPKKKMDPACVYENDNFSIDLHPWQVFDNIDRVGLLTHWDLCAAITRVNRSGKRMYVDVVDRINF